MGTDTYYWMGKDIAYLEHDGKDSYCWIEKDI